MTDPCSRIDTFGRTWVPVAVLVAIFGVQLLLGQGHVLLRRTLWFDELLTHSLVVDPDLPHALAALRDGVDYSPPGLVLSMRAAFVFSDEVTPTGLRLFTLACVILACVAVFLTLRTMFSISTCLATVLAIWAQPMILQHAFEARFYAPWLAAVSWFCFFLGKSVETKNRWYRVGLAITAVATSIVHWFGIISLILACLGHAWVSRPTRKDISIWLAALLGPLTLLICAPFFFGQRAALTVPTWINPPDARQVGWLLSSVTPLATISLCAMALWLSRVLARDPRGGSARVPAAQLHCSVASLSALIFMPLFLICFSFCVQPSIVPRYAIVAVIATAPVIAHLLSNCPRWLNIACCVLFTICGIVQFFSESQWARSFERRVDQMVELIDKQPQHIPIVFEDEQEMFAVLFRAPEVRTRCFFLDFESHELAQVTPARVIARDVTRRYDRHYGSLQFLRPGDVTQCERFVIVAFRDQSRLGFVQAGFDRRRLGDKMYEFRAKAGTTTDRAPQDAAQLRHAQPPGGRQPTGHNPGQRTMPD